MVLTPEERQAQRVLVGLVHRGASQLDPGGWRVWRTVRSQDGAGATFEEITEYLDTLNIPYEVEIRRGQYSSRRQVETAFEAVVRTKDLPALVRWVPSLQGAIDRLASLTGKTGSSN